ncbi:OmpA family protein [Roseivivax sp. GX 12232]|uniref:OmpA family protein n=1 Tax=Roseivivax sp. GX 12232 TaxID=2900547 RepID=UPI001E32E036|nr:OmpA family protein [Roseivivax sp. GX 12232]MCE0503912.1 OmpA family protein [Roseivivax sp. GX 12232]
MSEEMVIARRIFGFCSGGRPMRFKDFFTVAGKNDAQRRCAMLRTICGAIALCLCVPETAPAQGLTAEDCRQIRVLYDMEAPGCAARDAEGAPPARFRESSVFFRGGGTRLDAAAERQISKIAEILGTKALAGSCLKLSGHSDASGAPSVNLPLSTRRARVVEEALAAQIGRARIQRVEGLGAAEPMQELAAASAWQRRVTVYVRRCSAETAGL